MGKSIFLDRLVLIIIKLTFLFALRDTFWDATFILNARFVFFVSTYEFKINFYFQLI